MADRVGKSGWPCGRRAWTRRSDEGLREAEGLQTREGLEPGQRWSTSGRASSPERSAPGNATASRGYRCSRSSLKQSRASTTTTSGGTNPSADGGSGRALELNQASLNLCPEGGRDGSANGRLCEYFNYGRDDSSGSSDSTEVEGSSASELWTTEHLWTATNLATATERRHPGGQCEDTCPVAGAHRRAGSSASSSSDETCEYESARGIRSFLGTANGVVRLDGTSADSAERGPTHRDPRGQSGGTQRTRGESRYQHELRVRDIERSSMAWRANTGRHDGGSSSSSRSCSGNASASEGETGLEDAFVGSASIPRDTELNSDDGGGPGGGPTSDATAYYVRELLGIDMVDSQAKENSDQYQFNAIAQHSFALARSGGKANDLASKAKTLQQQQTELLVKLEERNGVSKKELDELIEWLGPQAHSLLCFKPKLVELFAGPIHRLSREVVKRGAESLHLGLCHGQDLATRKGYRLTGLLIDYLEPEDVWCAWVCKPWSTWSQVNEVKSEGAAETIRRGRAAGLKMLRLYFMAARKQWQGQRHVHGENPRNSLAYKE